MRQALIVVDMINDLVHSKGGCANYAPMVNEKNIIANINNAIDRAREANMLVVFVKVGFSEGYPERPRHSPFFNHMLVEQTLLNGTWGTELHSGIKAMKNDVVIHKTRINPFNATSLDVVLRSHAVTDIYLAGVATTWAIESAVRTAHDLDYRTFVVKDCCTDRDQTVHDHSLRTCSALSTICISTDIPMTSL